MDADPILDEVRAARAALLAQADGQLETLVLRLKQDEVASGRKPVDLGAVSASGPVGTSRQRGAG